MSPEFHFSPLRAKRKPGHEDPVRMQQPGSCSMRGSRFECLGFSHLGFIVREASLPLFDTRRRFRCPEVTLMRF